MVPAAPAPELPLAGPTAPPRANGELVFAAPWESRLFGVTLVLSEKGLFSWTAFQGHLIREIRRWESEPGAKPATYPYYHLWRRALEALLAEKGLCTRDEIASRAAVLEARPHGHDHHS
jgi:nitrile hydratase accessory protein